MSDEVWFHDIPDDWTSASTKYIFDIQLGKMLQPKQQLLNDRLIKYLKAQHVQWHSVITENLPEMWASPDEIHQYSVENGDLLVCEGGDVGRAGIVRDLDLEEEVIIQNALHRVRSKDNDTRFLEYVLRSVHASGWFDVLCNRATIAHFTGEKFGSMRIPFPPRETQNLIACFLDRKTEAIASLIEKKQRLIQLLEEKRTALINQAVTKGLNPNAPMKDSGIPWIGKIPRHWTVSRLRYLISDKLAGPYGSSLTKSMYVSSGYRVYGQQQVISDDFSVGDYYISAEKYKEMQRYTVYPKDVLVTVMGTIGRVSVVPEKAEPGIINPRLVRFVIRDEHMSPNFFAWVLRSKVGETQLLEMAQGSTMDGLNLAVLSDVWMPIPPLCNQPRILLYIEQTSQKYNNLRYAIDDQIQKLLEYRQSLITAAVTGKLEILEDAAA